MDSAFAEGKRWGIWKKIGGIGREMQLRAITCNKKADKATVDTKIPLRDGSVLRKTLISCPGGTGKSEEVESRGQEMREEVTLPCTGSEEFEMEVVEQGWERQEGVTNSGAEGLVPYGSLKRPAWQS